jgi:hypothetical protein
VFGRIAVSLGPAFVAMLVTAGCNVLRPAAAPPDCPPPPDPTETLTTAWQAYQPDQPLNWTVSVRRRLFALQALLLSAGMYGEPPASPATTFAQYAPQFVRDLGASRHHGLADALRKLAATLESFRDKPEADLAPNCGLVLARRSLRADPVSVATDWVVQAARPDVHAAACWLLVRWRAGRWPHIVVDHRPTALSGR